AAGAFGVMLVFNIMISLEFEKDKTLPSLTLIELGNKAYAQGEGGACLNSYHNQSYSKRSIIGGGLCMNANGESCGNQELCEYSGNPTDSCTDHVCSGGSSG
ncbi:hypothetical protein, partial [Lunatimonas salinarum]|uniref:hypothetical protein n=1 Tax=Lunatimonas salinarum TaxID=1774590 RepID=UPI001AE06C55